MTPELTGSDRVLRQVAILNGAACTCIGAVHAAFGAPSVIGLASADVNEDSQERFYGGLFAVYGAAWLAAANGEALQRSRMRWLAAGMAAGGVGRVLGMLRRGRPHHFWTAMAVVELAVPGAVFLLSRDSTPTNGH